MISVPEWLGDSAVLQRREPLEIKGKVTDGESAGESSGGPTDAAGDTADRRISLLLDGVEAASAVVEGDGRWSLMLPAQEAGGPHGIEIRSAGESRCFTDVLFGDVWVLGGQSNMELWLGRLLGRYPQVLDEATDTGCGSCASGSRPSSTRRTARILARLRARRLGAIQDGPCAPRRTDGSSPAATTS